MKKILCKLRSKERGQALMITLGFLTIGGLTLAPLLAHMSTGLNASKIHEKKLTEFYLADAAIELTTWRLMNESGFAEAMTPEDPSVQYTSDIDGVNVPTSITRLTGLGGDTLNLEVDYTIPSGHQLEFRITVIGDDHCHFAYDTLAYSSWLQVPTTTSGTLAYYLHNNPMPPTEDTDSQADLPMDEVPPSATDLYNYDQEFDTSPGRRIEESLGGPDGLEIKEYQNWRAAPYDNDTHLLGTVTVNLLVAPDSFNYDNDGAFKVFLRDYDPVSETYTEIASADYTVGEGEWVAAWQSTAPEGKYEIVTIAIGTELEATVALGFGYIRILSFTSKGGG
jgi:hypothetical protein